jgi:hypothetical protein
MTAVIVVVAAVAALANLGFAIRSYQGARRAERAAERSLAATAELLAHLRGRAL